MTALKVLDVKGVDQRVEKTEHQIETIRTQLHQIKQSIQNIVFLEDALAGKGGHAIRSFYLHAHLPFIAYLEQFLSNYEDMLQGLKQAVHGYESNQNGFVRQQFIEADMQQGLHKLLTTAQNITNDANDNIRSIQDLVSIAPLNDNELIASVKHLRNNAEETMDQLVQLDHAQSNTLESANENISTMETYLSKMASMFASGSFSIQNFHIGVLNDLDSYNAMLKNVNPMHYAMNKLKDVLDEKGPFFAMMAPYILFPLSYHNGISKQDGNFSKREIDMMMRSGDFKGLGIEPMNDQEIAAIEAYLQNYFIDGANVDQVSYLDNWIIPNGKYVSSKLAHLQALKAGYNNPRTIPNTNSPRDSYFISGANVGMGKGGSVIGGAGWYNHDWLGLGRSNNEPKGRIGGKSELSLVQGGMGLDSDFVDANFNTHAIKGAAEARVGGKSLLGLHLPLPLAKAEANAYTAGGRAQLDRNMPYVGDIVGGSGIEAKGKAGNALAYAGVDKGSIGVAAKASLAEGEISPIVPIPFTDIDVKFTVGGSLGSVGGEGKLGKETLIDLRALVGIKLGISFE